MATKITVNADDLMLALQSRDGGGSVGYIHRRSGGILQVVEGDEDAFDAEDDPLSCAYRDTPDDFFEIEPMASFESFRLMEDFVAGVEDDSARGRLAEALRGRRSFRRFKDALPDSLRDAWYRFEADRLRAYAKDWLELHLPEAELLPAPLKGD